MGTLAVQGHGPPVGIIRAAVAVALLLPPPVPVNQLTEVGRLFTVFHNELVLEELLGCGPLRGDTRMKRRRRETFRPPGGAKGQVELHNRHDKSHPVLSLCLVPIM